MPVRPNLNLAHPGHSINERVIESCAGSHTRRFLKNVMEGAPLYDKPEPRHTMVAESKMDKLGV
jgi:hypothetical protein